MSKIPKRKLIVGLEIGTVKVIVLIGEILPDGNINILGLGNCPSYGMDKGNVNNLELVVKCVKDAICQAELMANCHISSVYLSMSSKYIRCQNEIGIVPIAEEEVTQEDINNVMYTAKSVKISDEYRILHVIPQEYKIDYQERTKNPIGLSGIRIQAKVHLITCHNEMIKNIVKVVERCGVKVSQLIFAGLASSYAVLTEEEKELGACVVDIGGGTMDIAIYTDGALRHTKVIPYAGNIVTRDIAYAFGTPLNEAEIIKINYGCALGSIVNKKDTVDISNNIGIRVKQNYHLQKYTLAEVIEPRYVELLNLVNNEIISTQNELKNQKIKYDISAGIVLTGGGSQIEGLLSCAQKVFNTQVRIGYPIKVNGLKDYDKTIFYSTVIGLLQYGKQIYFNNKINKKKYTLLHLWYKKISNWLRREF